MRNEERYPEMPVVLIDDEEQIVNLEASVLEVAGFTNVIPCTSPSAAREVISGLSGAIVVLDINMPETDGITFLEYVRQNHPETAVIMLTGYNDAQTAVTCLKQGAFDYIVKPVDSTRLISVITHAVQHLRMQSDAERLSSSLRDRQLKNPQVFSEIITADAGMFDLFRYVEALAPTTLPVLLTGETGVGKELFARAVHRASGRRGEFVCVNTAGIDATLFADTLFGHRTGAFTGATSSRRGIIEKAADGTLFLDEIGDLPMESQVKLLRLLQEGTYYRLGCETEERSTARIVAATNRSLDSLRTGGGFRQDLFFRLKAHHISIPALRDRHGDLELLTPYFVGCASREQNRKAPGIPPQVYPILRNYAFPGNIRELRGIVFDAVSRCDSSTLSTAPFRKAVKQEGGALPERMGDTPDLEPVFPAQLPTMRQMENALIKEALRRTDGNKKLAADLLGISRATVASKAAK